MKVVFTIWIMDSFDNTKILSLACKALVDKNQNMHEVNSQLFWILICTTFNGLLFFKIWCCDKQRLVSIFTCLCSKIMNQGYPLQHDTSSEWFLEPWQIKLHSPQVSTQYGLNHPSSAHVGVNSLFVSVHCDTCWYLLTVSQEHMSQIIRTLSSSFLFNISVIKCILNRWMMNIMKMMMNYQINIFKMRLKHVMILIFFTPSPPMIVYHQRLFYITHVISMLTSFYHNSHCLLIRSNVAIQVIWLIRISSQSVLHEKKYAHLNCYQW